MLQKVAFDGLISDKIVFKEKDLPDHELCRIDHTCFGLLQSTECYSPTVISAPVLTFNFYHLELQEYFAAKHIISLPEGKAYDLIRKRFFAKYNEWDPDDTCSSGEDGSDGSNESIESEDSQSDSDHSGSDEHPDDICIRLLYVWIFLFGLTKGKFAPLQYYLSMYNDSDKEEKDERYFIVIVCNDLCCCL